MQQQHSESLERVPPAQASSDFSQLGFGSDTLRAERERRPYHGRELSLGATVVGCHGIDPEGREIVVAHNYTSGVVDVATGRRRTPHVSPNPELDYPVGFIPCATLQPRERALTLTLQPGMIEYLCARGLLQSPRQIVEVNPEVGPNGELGYGYTDLLFQARQQGLHVAGNPFFVASFPTNEVRQIAAGMGMLPIQRSDPEKTSDKAQLRIDAPRYGLCMSRGFLVHDERGALAAAVGLAQAGKVWVKLPRGVGGDLVRAFSLRDSGDPAELLQHIYACRKLFRGEWEKAMSQTNLSSEEREEFWPEASFAPPAAPFVVEADVAFDEEFPDSRGTIEVIGSNIMLVHHDGSFELRGDFIQNTDAQGSFNGSKPFKLSAAAAPLLVEEMRKCAQYCAEELKIFGLVGWDYALVRRSTGELTVKLIEMNGRPSASALATMVAKKVGAVAWEQVGISTEGALNNFEDLRGAVGDSLLFGSVAHGGVVPLNLRALHERRGDGSYRRLTSSHNAKLLIFGEHAQQVEAIKAELRGGGIKVG